MFYLPYKQRSVISGQRGAALIVALLVFAIASALMVGLQRDFTLQLQRGSNSFSQVSLISIPPPLRYCEPSIQMINWNPCRYSMHNDLAICARPVSLVIWILS